MSGRGQEGSATQLDTYQKNSKKAAVGKNMRTYSRTKVSQFITSWDDANYFLVFNNYFYTIADATGDVDANTVIGVVFEKWLNLAWELYYKNANLKDLVAADETSWKLYWATYFCIATEIQLQYNMRCYLPAYTESDIVPGSGTAISFFSQASFDIFCASMAEYPAPKGVWELVDVLCTWLIKMSNEYERFTVRIPAAYCSPFNTQYDLADLEAMRALLRVNLGGFETHATKYGLGKGSWRDPIKPTIKTWNDVDVIAFLNYVQFNMYDNQPDQQLVYPDGGYTGVNSTTSYTLVEQFFKDDPNESLLHLLGPLFGTWEADHNPYGGWILTGQAATTEYKVNMMTCAHHGTAMSTCSLIDKNALTLLYHTKAVADGGSAVFQTFFNGTNFTAAQNLAGCWSFASDAMLLYGIGRGATETNNDLLNYLGKLLR